MAHQESYPPPPNHASDSRYLHPQANYSSSANMSDLDQIRSRESTAHDGYTSDSSQRYSRARQPINEAISSAFTNSPATTSAIAPEILAQLTSQITASVIRELKASNISAPGITPSVAAETKSSSGGSPPIDRSTVYTPPSPYPPPDQRSPGKPVGLGFDVTNDATMLSPSRRTSPPLHYSSNGDDDLTERPKGPQRISTSGDMTVVEKIWGTLFSEEGEKTPRLGQFLRGIAMHLIEDYEPKGSLVVTPLKMQRYYQETKLDAELIPWRDIFDDRTSSISRMLRELEVSHHLIQNKLSERPDVPGLTPEGFEKWYFLMIRAHPDQEYARLAKTALEMPINNPDDKKERFPKELSRRLFPGRGDDVIEAMLCQLMSRYCNLNLKSRHNSTVQEPRPNVEPRVSAPSLHTNVVPNEPADTDPRPQSFSSTSASGEAVVSDTDDAPTPQPIERERKPYAAQPGGGKNFDNLNAPTESSRLRRSSSNRESRTSRPDDVQRPRPSRIDVHQTQSSAQPMSTAPLEIPESSRRHRNSQYYRDNPPQTARPASPPNGAPRRTRSPSTGNFSTRYTDSASEYTHYSAGAGTEDRDRRFRDYESGRERLAGDKFDSARMSAYDPRNRERDGSTGAADMRPRGHSMAGFGVPSLSDEEYYRSLGSSAPGHAGRGSIPTGEQYPSSSYRDGR